VQRPAKHAAPPASLDDATQERAAAGAHRPIRSFVLRQGRMSRAQRRAHETLLAHFGLPYASQRLDLAAAFGRDAPTILEIGFGMGETTALVAQAHPEINYLGVEVHAPGVGSLLKQIEQRGLRNVRIVQHDAMEVIEYMLAPGSLDGVFVFFPDPWPKKRHHKRRLVQPPFARALALRLKPAGVLHLATDWHDYAVQMLEVLRAEPLLENTAADFAPRPEYRPHTKFEQRGLRLGHGVWDVIFRRSG
jgi:tRNA (guanine-N7-)-methyltransferase